MRTTDLQKYSSFEAMRIARTPISAVLLHEDHFFVGTNEGVLQAFRARSREQVADMEGHESVIRCLVMIDTTTRLVSGCDDKSIAIWDTAPIGAVKDSANCIHMQPLYFLSGPKAAIITMHPYVLEDGRRFWLQY
jgi:WD40 repeat protein